LKIARFDDGKVGVVVGDRIVDVSAAVQRLTGSGVTAWPSVAMNQLIAGFASMAPALRKAAEGPGVPLASVKLLTPVPAASKVIAYPINYHDHGIEMGRDTRATNLGFFLKPPSSLCGASEPIVLPALPGRRIDHECELAIVIGTRCRDVKRADWASVIFGYSCLMDIVVRGKEERVARKAYDSFCPVGPWIMTADELGDPNALQGRLWVNDELRQDANTRDLVLDIPGMIEVASHIMTLEPGDIIACGTPAGVGPIKGGDVVRIEFERIGGMTMKVVQGNGGAASIFEAAPAA
jgi:2-keto-4-pentenoate hydratase/2-oxohepta-3-ene-1,7-dioic acid hydratase in catechol pathway